jgi:ATP-dependent RNA circularization protein (DNA/RNA ligase family)
MYHKYPDVDRLTAWLVDNKDYLSSSVEVTEKLDGSNFSFHKSNGDTIWRSRSGIIKPENLNNFQKSIDFVNPSIAKLKDNEVIFGENVAIHHRIHYCDSRYPFYAFGIYNTDNETFDKNWRSRCTKLGLPCVNEIARGTFTLEELLDMRAGESAIGEVREGIVIKDYDKQLICKLVDPKYEESHTQKPPRVPIVIHEETQEFVNMHCTTNRVLKAIFRLHDEDGETFNMSMMGLLPRAVEADIYKECSVPETINVKQMKKMIADISRETLNKYLNGEIE